MTIEGHRHRLRLPRNPWLKNVLQHAQVEVSWADPKPEPTQKFELVGLLQADFAQLQAWDGPLTAWSKEGIALHDYYHSPVDSFIVQASNIFWLDESVPVYHKVDIRGRESTIKGSDGISLPVGVTCNVLGSATGSALKLRSILSENPSKCQLQDVLSRWGVPLAELGKIAAHMVPEPVCQLLLRGKWQDLLCLSRWAWFKSPQSCSGMWEGFTLPELLRSRSL